MKLNRKELRKIQYDFNSCSNRLLQANYEDYADVLGKFVNYIESTPIISDYIHDCGNCDWNLENEVKELRSQLFSLMNSICTDLTCQLRKWEGSGIELPESKEGKSALKNQIK